MTKTAKRRIQNSSFRYGDARCLQRRLVNAMLANSGLNLISLAFRLSDAGKCQTQRDAMITAEYLAQTSKNGRSQNRMGEDVLLQIARFAFKKKWIDEALLEEANWVYLAKKTKTARRKLGAWASLPADEAPAYDVHHELLRRVEDLVDDGHSPQDLASILLQWQAQMQGKSLSNAAWQLPRGQWIGISSQRLAYDNGDAGDLVHYLAESPPAEAFSEE